MKSHATFFVTLITLLTHLAVSAEQNTSIVMARSILDQNCAEQIRYAVLERTIVDFKMEVSSMSQYPVKNGEFTIAGTEKWRMSSDFQATAVFSNESRPFEGEAESLADGRAELKSYVNTIFPAKNTNGGMIGFSYLVKTRLQPVKILSSSTKDLMDGTDQTEGYIVADGNASGSCVSEIEKLEVYNLSTLSEMMSNVSPDDQHLIQELLVW